VIAEIPGMGTWGAMSYGTLYTGGNGRIMAVVLKPPAASSEFATGICTVLPPLSVSIAMDWDASGNDDLDFDRPQEQKKYTFWVNNDVDGPAGIKVYPPHPGFGEDDHPKGTINCDDNIINTLRDLEDFSKLHIKIDDSIKNREGVTYWLRFAPAGSGGPAPSINLFSAVDGTTNYLKDKNIATQQVEYPSDGFFDIDGNWIYTTYGGSRLKLLTVESTDIQIPDSAIIKNGDITPFIFEGKAKGKGNLIFTAKQNDIPIAESSLELALADITEFYDKYVVKTVSEDSDIVKSEDEIKDNTIEPEGRPYSPETSDYILYVHGWNMEGWEKDRWAETVFKRLYWQGYRGHVGSFQWPTYEEKPLDNIDIGLPHIVKYLSSYNPSEYRAYQSGRALARRLEKLIDDGKKVHIIAHSMGNVVVGQALRELGEGYKIQNYIATQAAIAAHMYDNTVPGLGSDEIEITTPNLYGYYFNGTSKDLPYLDSVWDKVEKDKNGVPRMFNYFNVDDWALKRWLDNNKGTLLTSGKPDIDHDYNYIGDLDSYWPDITSDAFVSKINGILRIPQDRFEIFAYCIRTRSNPLGAEGGLVKGFTKFDLKNLGFDEWNYSHSKQFRSNIVDEWNYWKQVIEHFFDNQNEY
jgi:pimeloyl-ACP methyl ester carboxylesterase